MNGRRVGHYFIAFFGFIAAVNAVMITLAIRTHTGVITEHPYEKGLAYNQVIKTEAEQATLGWSSTIEYTNGALHFNLEDRDKHPITPEQAIATITRPTQAGMDFAVTLTSTETAIDFPKPGLWNVQVDATYRGTHYQRSKRIVVE